MITVYHSTARLRALTKIGEPKAGSWIDVVEPTELELDSLSEQYNLDRDLLNDAVDVYEAPRVEDSDGAVYIFTRFCYPDGQEVATSPLLIIYNHNYLFTVTRTQTDVLSRMTSEGSELATTQKTKLLLQILAEINYSYRRQLNQVSKEILRIRARIRQSELSNRDFLSFIELEEDLNEYLAALQPQATMFTSLLKGRYIKLYEDDRDLIEDLTLGVTESIELAKSRLRTLVNIHQAYDAIATNNLNRTFKRLTSIAIFLTIPTIVGGLWGMNIALPFANHPLAFVYVLAIILSLSCFAVWLFRRNKWL